MDTITIKIYKADHKRLAKAHAKAIGKRGKAFTFQAFIAEIIAAGLAETITRFNNNKERLS